MPHIRLTNLYAQNPDGDQAFLLIKMKDEDQPRVLTTGNSIEIDYDQIEDMKPVSPHYTADAAAIMPRSDSPHTSRVPPEVFVKTMHLGDKGKEPQTPPANSLTTFGETILPNNEATRVDTPRPGETLSNRPASAEEAVPGQNDGAGHPMQSAKPDDSANASRAAARQQPPNENVKPSTAVTEPASGSSQAKPANPTEAKK